MIEGCVAPSPRPRRNAIAASSGTGAHQREDRVGDARDAERRGDHRPLAHAPRDPRQRQAHEEGGGGEAAEDEADGRGREPDRGAVDRHHEHEEVPRAREQPRHEEDAAQLRDRAAAPARCARSALARRVRRVREARARRDARHQRARRARSRRAAGTWRGGRACRSRSPTNVGPMKFEIEKPSASQPKLSLRASSALLISPTVCCTRDVEEHEARCRCPPRRRRARRCPGTSAGQRHRQRRAAPPRRCSGLRTPMRSTSRPAATPSNIGSAAKSDMITPTVSGEAPSDERVQRDREAAAVERGVGEDGGDDDQR